MLFWTLVFLKKNKNINFQKIKESKLQNLFSNWLDKNDRLIDRFLLCSNLLTGYLIVDLFFPIGRGQRQLILGNKNVGKTFFLKNLINYINTYYNTFNYFGLNKIFCIFVSIGGSKKNLKPLFYNSFIYNKFLKILDYSSSYKASKRYISVYHGILESKIFKYSGLDCLVLFDSLSSHAEAYREVLLKLKESPGREAFPGGIFYIHANILERFSQLNRYHKYGSSTCIPVIEIQNNDTTGYISTNIISITDGQWFFNNIISKDNKYPAIDFEKSISRIGDRVQPWIYKKTKRQIQAIFLNGIKLNSMRQSNISLKFEDSIKLKQAIGLMSLLYCKKTKSYFLNVVGILFCLLNLNYCNNNVLNYFYIKLVIKEKLGLIFLINFSIFLNSKLTENKIWNFLCFKIYNTYIKKNNK